MHERVYFLYKSTGVRSLFFVVVCLSFRSYFHYEVKIVIVHAQLDLQGPTVDFFSKNGKLFDCCLWGWRQLWLSKIKNTCELFKIKFFEFIRFLWQCFLWKSDSINNEDFQASSGFFWKSKMKFVVYLRLIRHQRLDKLYHVSWRTSR